MSTVAAEFDQDSQEGGLADRLAKIEEPRNSRKPTYANTNLYGPAVRPVETQVTTYYLELLSVEGLNPSGPELPDLEIREAKIASPELGRFLYTAWGRAWRWTDRLNWPYSKWLAHLEGPGVEVWIAYLDGVIAGYVELERQPGESVEIVYFGLLRQFMGRGIGGLLLSDTVERAFRRGAQRVWLHTCSLDSPRAIENYQARGFKLFNEETVLKDVPPAPRDEAGW